MSYMNNLMFPMKPPTQGNKHHANRSRKLFKRHTPRGKAFRRQLIVYGKGLISVLDKQMEEMESRLKTRG
jgi:hypothetical protein